MPGAVEEGPGVYQGFDGVSVHRWDAKVDANQRQIIEALRVAGALVWSMGQPFDLLVRFRREWFVLEVKNKEAKGKYTVDQQDNLRRIAAQEGVQDAVRTVWSVDQALEAIGAKGKPENRIPALYSLSTARAR